MNYFQRLITVLLVSFVGGKGFGQTCIVIKKTKDAIYVGADSRSSEQRKSFSGGVFNVYHDDICKIRPNPPFYFSAAGRAHQELFRYFLRRVRTRADLEDIYTNPNGILNQDTISSILEPVLALYKRGNGLKQCLYDSSAIFSGIAILSFVSDTATVLLVEFYKDNGIWYRTGENITSIKIFGHHDAADRIVGKKSTWKDGIIPGIKNLIKIEIRADSTSVNGPIDILIIKKDGYKWSAVKPNCR